MTPQIIHLTDNLIGVVGFREEPKKCYISTCVERGVFTEHPCLDIKYKVGLRVMRLPDGNWQIVGWSTELDEATCAGLVDEPYATGIEQYTEPTDLTGWTTSQTPMGVKYSKVIYCGYRDYTKDCDGYSAREQHPFKSATDSFASLLRSYGIEGRALILRRID